MDTLPIDKHHAVYLLIAVGWTCVFSLTIKRPVRGLRNLGILACYILAVVMLIRLPFVTALVTWCVFGLAAGIIYSAYQLLAYARDKSPDRKLDVSVSTFVHGPLAWPIMIPEAVEYLLAELGVLRVQPTPPPTKTDAPPAAS
jgi:hypothetical protein